MVKFLYYLWDKKNADGIKTKVLTEHEEGKTMKQMRQMSVINEFAAGEDYVDWIKGRASGDFELFDDEYKGNVTFTDGEVVAIHSKKGLNDAAMSLVWMGIDYELDGHTDIKVYECDRCNDLGCEYCRPSDFM